MREDRNRERNASTPSHRQTFADDINLLLAALTPRSEGSSKRSDRVLRQRPGTPAAVDASVDELVSQLMPDLQRHLDTLNGKTFGPEANADLAKSITRLLRRLGLAIECPKCSEPAVSLRYDWCGTSVTPVFRYEHSASSRHGGTTALGPLKLILRNPGR
jgi:hypothetical protein